MINKVNIGVRQRGSNIGSWCFRECRRGATGDGVNVNVGVIVIVSLGCGRVGVWLKEVSLVLLQEHRHSREGQLQIGRSSSLFALLNISRQQLIADRYQLILIKPSSTFPAQISRIHHFSQQWGRAVFVFAQVALQDFHDE